MTRSSTANTKKSSRTDREFRDSTTVALLDRQRIFREGLEALLKDASETTLVASIWRPVDVHACLSRVTVDVFLLEIDFPGEDLLRLIKDWSREFPHTAFVVLSGLDEVTYAERCIRAGARGFVSKQEGFETLSQAIRKVRKGQLAASAQIEAILLSNYSRLRNGWDVSSLDLLSDRELLVLNLVAQAQNTSRIARAMGISPKTVGTYKERIKEKLNLNDSQQLMQYAGLCFASGQTRHIQRPSA